MGAKNRCKSDSFKFLQIYGRECSLYTSDTTICEGVVRPGIDCVYVASRLGNQSTIAQLLNKNIQITMTLLTDHDQNCVKQVFTSILPLLPFPLW